MTNDDAQNDKTKNDSLQWHPAFLEAIRAELFDYRDVLEFRQEFPLNAAPLQIDLLIIKKKRNIVIDKNIARIFRKDNIVEYKGPGSCLLIKDFWKACVYANLYALITPGVDLADVTLTFIESRHPGKLLKYLTGTRGYTVEETSPGIYLVKGDYIPIQIIESPRLSEDENLWLNSLRRGLKKSRLGVILEEGKKRWQKTPLGAYIDIIVRANKKAYMEVNKMWQDTLTEFLIETGTVARWQEEWKEQAMEQIMEEVIEQGIEQGIVQGIEQGIVQGIEQGIVQGIEQGMERTARNLLSMGMPIEDIARASELPVEKIRSLAAAAQ